ncbi:MAG: hypothetical protein AAF431_01250 [Pseudomonadota bacterium]
MQRSKLIAKFLAVVFLGAMAYKEGFAQDATGAEQVRAVSLEGSEANEVAEGYTGASNSNGAYGSSNKAASEFDNHSDLYVRSPANADPDYEDTEFGTLLYNEASLPTRLEVLRLLSKDTPSALVFLQAVSMGLGVDDVLTAAVRYEPNKGRDFAQSAITILPWLDDAEGYDYGSYELDDLEREDDSKPYSIAEVAERFFEEREILLPHPDWYEGQIHFEASATELKELGTENQAIKWYRNNSTKATRERPVFVSLYEANHDIVIDAEDRIDRALAEYGPEARLPVVFIYNRLNERPVDQLVDYPKTILGMQKAFTENSLMVTPTPEWQTGEFHIQAKLEEIYQIFDMPDEEDFEPEQWQRLLEEAENYNVADTSFLCVALSTGEGDSVNRGLNSMMQLASYDDPRSEENFPYAAPGGEFNLKDMLRTGLIINRLDLIAALNTLGVTEIPLSFYYINSARVKPYTRGPRGLLALAIGAGTPPGNVGGTGGFGPPPEDPPQCASPPCSN